VGQNQQHIDEQAREQLRDTIGRGGWKDIAELAIDAIEFVVDLCNAGQLRGDEIEDFSHGVQVTINILWELGDGSYEEDVRRLCEAVESFNHAKASRRDLPLKNEGRENWPLYKAMAWCQHLQDTRQFLRECSDSWRCELDRALRKDSGSALKCIEQIEKRIPIFHSARLANVSAQSAALTEVLLLNAQLTVYAGHSEPLRRCSNSIWRPNDGLNGSQGLAAFSRAILGDDFKGHENWLNQDDPLRWVKKEAKRLDSLYDNDGRLDSTEKVIHERAYIDPLYDETGHMSCLGTIERYSREVVEHPSVQLEIENFDAVCKEAGLNPAQRKALILRRNGKIMSRKDLKEWRRSQRAVSRNRSALVTAITAATKKRVIKPPLLSSGSYSGVVREGAGYTLPLPYDDKPTQRLPAPEAIRWFDSAPPPISRSVRKTKHLFRKVSAQP
jgi:hypothetical protein